MAQDLEFTGFGDVRLNARVYGDDENPAVLLVHGGGQTGAVWDAAAHALVSAGRCAIVIELRGHGSSEWPADGSYHFEAFVGDLRSILTQLGRRPVIVAAGIGGWLAVAALGDEAATLAVGLVFVDLPTDFSPAATGRVGDRLRATLAEGTPAWDARWLDNWQPGDVASRLVKDAPRLKLPVLVVHGELSDVAAAQDALEFVASLPDGELAQVAGARLLVADQRIEDLNAILLDFLERRHPRRPPEFRSGSDARTLRDALGCFATGITIVTTTVGDVPIGLTANSFTSLSLDPPLLIVCISNSAGSAGALRVAEHFAINILQIGQQLASNCFAGKGEDRFAGTAWTMGEKGAPILDGSLAAFECSRYAVHEGGDHFILIGEVHKATFEPWRDPLLYFRGKYRRLHFT